MMTENEFHFFLIQQSADEKIKRDSKVKKDKKPKANFLRSVWRRIFPKKDVPSKKVQEEPTNKGCFDKLAKGAEGTIPTLSCSYAALKGQYVFHKTLGTGSFAKVKLATHIHTGEKVAVKIINKEASGETLNCIRLEIEALKELRHQNICQLFQIVETKSKIFLVMEYCSGGDLFNYVCKKKRLIEEEARLLFRQLVAAVAYLHGKGYSHRDLKPENILLDENHGVKLIDFGLCAKPKNGVRQQLRTQCGSPGYAAPELICGVPYNGSKVDVWSMGVLLYEMLCGFLPFDDDTISKMYSKIQSGKYSCPEWLSSESKAVLSEILQVDPEKRISINILLTHAWVTHGLSSPVKWQSNYEFPGDVISNAVRTSSKTYNQLAYFEHDRTVGMREAGCLYRPVGRHLHRTDIVVQRRLHEWLLRGTHSWNVKALKGQGAGMQGKIGCLCDKPETDVLVLTDPI